jgi:hypothetical protein
MILGQVYASTLVTMPLDGQPAPPVGVALLRQEADLLKPLVHTRISRAFLDATAELPRIEGRTIYSDDTSRTYFTESTARERSQSDQRKLTRVAVDESFYYTTKYGSPLAYVRPIELLGLSRLDHAHGLRILDFGYGMVGHLRLLASMGADITGIDVDPLLPALYSHAEDQGVIKNPRGPSGRLRLLDGRFPADPTMRKAVNTDYDLFLSKNTLKKGYVHPDRPVQKNRLLNLDVDDETFVRAVGNTLRPGGLVMIYNITPAPSPPDQPYKNWADGRCPFPRHVWESAGFEILAFDRDDSPAVREVAHALGWDRGESPIDLKSDLFAAYSLFRKPRRLESD